MPIVPKDFSLLAVNELSGVLKDNHDLREPLTRHMTSVFATYRHQVRDATTDGEFKLLTDGLAASVKQAYCFHVVALDKKNLIDVLDRTVLSLCLRGETLYGYLYLVPETVKAIDYHHSLFADKLH